MFEDKKPSWSLALAIGVVMEVFHLTMVFITNMVDTTQAMEVVRACAIPMVTANGLSVMLATMFVTVASKENLRFTRENVNISQTIQRWLLLCVVVAFLLSTGMYRLQTGVAEEHKTRTRHHRENQLIIRQKSVGSANGLLHRMVRSSVKSKKK